MILAAQPKPDDRKSLGTHTGAAEDLGPMNPNPTFFPARELSPSSSVRRDYVSDSNTDLPGVAAAASTLPQPSGHQATSASSENHLSSPDVTTPMEGSTVQELVQTTTTIRGNTSILASTNPTENCPSKLGNKVLILTFESALALIAIRFQALDHSPSLLSSFLVIMVSATTVFGFTFTLVGLMLEKAGHPVLAAVSSHAGSISAVLGFFFMMALFVPERVVWLIWAGGGLVSLVYVYSLAKPSYNSSTPLSLSNCFP